MAGKGRGGQENDSRDDVHLEEREAERGIRTEDLDRAAELLARWALRRSQKG